MPVHNDPEDVSKELVFYMGFNGGEGTGMGCKARK